jgi:hypothetical protein
MDVTTIRLLQCGDGQLFDVETPGSWYFVEGIPGGRLRASTCSEATNFKHRITLFSGENCDSRSCLASGIDPDLDCPYTDASDATNATYIEWESAPGQNFYIFVHNFFAGDSGDFGLNVREATPPPENNLCNSAVDVVNTYQFVAGSSVGATFDIGVKCDRCIDSGPKYPGVWYRIPAQGIDTEVVATVCSEFLSFNISIYTGTCDEFECVDSLQELGLTCNSAGMATNSTWTADKGQEYYILVHATENGDLETAPFEILLSKSESKDGGGGDGGGGDDGNGSGSSASSLAVGFLAGVSAAFLVLGI